MQSCRAVTATVLLVTLLFGVDRDAVARPGDKETLRVPARRVQLVEDLLRETAEVDRAAAAEEARTRREAERKAAVEAAERRQIEMRTAAETVRAEREAERARVERERERTRALAARVPASAPATAAEPTPSATLAAETGDAEAATAVPGVPSAAERDLPPLPAPETLAERSSGRDAASAAPAATAPALSGSASQGLGDQTRLAVAAGAVLLVGGWALRRRRKAGRASQAMPPHLRTLGKIALNNRWQVTLLELPDEVLVLGAGDQGVQVLTRISDPERIEALRRAHEEGGRGFGRLLRGLLDRSAAPAAATATAPAPKLAPDDGEREARWTREDSWIRDGVPARDAAAEDAAPAEILAAEKAFELHRAFNGGAHPIRTNVRPTFGSRGRDDADEARELLEVELMKQRLADLRAGRFAQ